MVPAIAITTLLPLLVFSTFGTKGIIEGFGVPFLLWICMCLFFAFPFGFRILRCRVFEIPAQKI
jgi:hypothetical protein